MIWQIVVNTFLSTERLLLKFHPCFRSYPRLHLSFLKLTRDHKQLMIELEIEIFMFFEQITYPFMGIDQRISSCTLTICRRPDFDVVIIKNSDQVDETLPIKKLEVIAAGVTQDYQIDPDRTCWLMQTPEPLNLLGEYRKIPIQNKREGMTLDTSEQPWSYLSKSEVEIMTGASLRAAA